MGILNFEGTRFNISDLGNNSSLQEFYVQFYLFFGFRVIGGNQQAQKNQVLNYFDFPTVLNTIESAAALQFRKFLDFQV